MKKIIFKCVHYILTFFRFLLSFINGWQSCVLCGSKTILVPLCKNCRKKYFQIKLNSDFPRCSVCGKELISTHNICTACEENPVLKSSDKVIPLFSYRLWNKELMFLWKMKGIRSLSLVFADFIAKALINQNIKTVVPVPPRKGKIKENGWDQIDELCKYLKYFYGFNILKILERKSSVQQKKLDRNKRLESIEGAYSILEKNKLKKTMKNIDFSWPDKVCLLDDVCTTGSTLEACSKILKMTGIQTVICMTLFIVD